MKPALSRKIIGEFLLYGVFIAADVEGIWPQNRLFALILFAVGTIGLVLHHSEVFSARQASIISTVIVILSLVAYEFVKPRVPFAVVTGAKLWTRTFSHGLDPDPPIVAYTFHPGVFVAGIDAPNSLMQGVDLLIKLAITNVGGTPRRITEYGVEVAGFERGPWVTLCPINFRFAEVFFASDPKVASKIMHREDMLDTQLTEHALQAGDTLAGWVGFVCPAHEPSECRPAFLRYTIVDSLGEKSQYTVRNAQVDDAPLHDWLAEAYLRPEKVDRDFTEKKFVRGNCGSNAGFLSEMAPGTATAPK